MKNFFLPNISFDLLVLVVLGIFTILLYMLVRLAARNNTQIRKILSSMSSPVRIAEKVQVEVQKMLKGTAMEIQSFRGEIINEIHKNAEDGKLEISAVESRYKEVLKPFSEEAALLLKKYNSDVESELKKLREIATSQIKEYMPQAEARAENSKKHIDAIMHSFEDTIKKTEQSYIQFVSSLEKIIDEQLLKNKEYIKSSLEKLPEKFDTAVDELEKESRVVFLKHMDKEFENAKHMIEEYKHSKMTFLDSNIVALVEETATLSLGKNLKMEEHVEFVYAALEEAKRKGVLGGK